MALKRGEAYYSPDEQCGCEIIVVAVRVQTVKGITVRSAVAAKRW